MSKKTTLYAFIAAAVATIVSGLVYASAQSSMATYAGIGEGTAQETGRLLFTVNYSRAMFALMGLVTLMIFIRFITLKPKPEM